MIYNLKELAKEFNEAIDQADAVRTSGRALLAIAERLEALVEAQKPRWVEFEWFTESSTSEGRFAINANDINGVSEVLSGGVITHCEIFMKTDDILHYVKGTLAEVLAKLRGGK